MIPSPVIWSFTALAITIFMVAIYFAIFFFVLLVIGYAILFVIKPIIEIVKTGKYD
jgi:hypothetical protein